MRGEIDVLVVLYSSARLIVYCDYRMKDEIDPILKEHELNEYEHIDEPAYATSFFTQVNC